MDNANIYASEERFWGAGDGETIQNAVDYAAKTGINRVVIPAFNARTQKPVWVIERAVILPGDMTVVVEDAHLQLAPGVFDNIFRSANCFTEQGNTMEGELRNIRIIGVGNALLDGGEHNGLVEQMHRDNPEKYPRLSVNLLIFLHNVRDFTVKGFRIIESRWWSICCIYCRYGLIKDLTFEMHATHENQDGVDLRIGCEYITIENIYGITGDDTVAMTALPNDDLVPEVALHVEGKSFDIHDITIRNIHSCTHGCNVVRFLCEDGAKEYNITVDGVHDTGEVISSAAITFGIGNTRFVKERGRVMGEFRNISIRNVSTNSQKGLQFCEPMQDVYIENYSTYGENEVGIWIADNSEFDNVIIENAAIRNDAGFPDTVLHAKPRESAYLFRGLTVRNINVTEARHFSRNMYFHVEGRTVGGITEEEHINAPLKLTSPYGRYHRFFFGQEIKERPKDAQVKD